MKLPFNKKTAIALIAVFLGLVAGAILMLLTGNNPFLGYWYLFRGSLMNIERFGNTLATATPLILTGLSVAFAFNTGLFNIGASGQMLVGGLCATAIGLTFPQLPRPILLSFMILGSIIGGGLWGSIPGYLKAKFNVHEVVATIMMNWIAFWVVNYTIPAYFKGEFLETESQKISDVASLKTPWLTELFQGSYINQGLTIGIIVIVIIWIILNKTTMGFELKAAGFNRFGAEYAGMKVQTSIISSMTIAGALAGLAGATFYVGYASSMQIGILPDHGFNGIAVSLLGGNSPLGVLGAALFFGLLLSGKGFMNAMTEIPDTLGDIIIAIILYFAATSVLIERALDYVRKALKGRKKDD